MSHFLHRWPSPPLAWADVLPRWCSEGPSLTPDSAGVELVAKVCELDKKGRLCPPLEQVWQALEWTSPEEVKVVLLGQDPYHGLRQAHGLAFSVADPLLPWPPSLRNIFKERAVDLDVPLERSANLEDWARQGVLMLNAVLTTRLGQAGAHAGLGWEEVVMGALHGVMARRERVVWILWGRPAQALHDKAVASFASSRQGDVCLASPHPSPLAAHRGFWGSRPFSKTNEVLRSWKEAPILW